MPSSQVALGLVFEPFPVLPLGLYKPEENDSEEDGEEKQSEQEEQLRAFQRNHIDQMARIEAPYMLWRFDDERDDHELFCMSLGKAQLTRLLMIDVVCDAESAWIGETMVGFVVFRFFSITFQDEVCIEELHIEQLVVDKDRRRQEIGTKLLGRMLEKADSVSVRVDEYDKVAHRFLGKCGFKCVTPRATTEDWLGGYDSIDRSPIRFQWPGPPRYRFSRQKAAVPCPVVPGPQAVFEMQR